MGRRPKYSSDQILDAAESLLAIDGPSALGVTRVAEQLGAPSGSIYHRFESRDLLVASLWLRAVENFQDALGPALDLVDPLDAARMLAKTVLLWSRENTSSAQVLMLHRSADLLDGGWPPDLVERNVAQLARFKKMIDDLCRRLSAKSSQQRRRVVFAVVDIPYGAVRSSLSSGLPPPVEVDDIVDDALAAVLAPFSSWEKS